MAVAPATGQEKTRETARVAAAGSPKEAVAMGLAGRLVANRLGAHLAPEATAREVAGLGPSTKRWA